MKIVGISDTHCHPLDQILKGVRGDLLVHAGDALNLGSAEEYYPFLQELEAVRPQFKHVVYIPGNHDFFVEQQTKIVRAEMKKINVHVLIHERLVLDGISFFGSPYVPLPPTWAFSFGSADQTHRWRAIEKMNVLITHGPPRDILDQGYGCEYLREAVERLKPELHLFGHIHERGGEQLQWDQTYFVNLAICNRQYRPAVQPFVIDFKKSKATV